jgi:hypothetical protein
VGKAIKTERSFLQKFQVAAWVIKRRFIRPTRVRRVNPQWPMILHLPVAYLQDDLQAQLLRLP